MRASNISLLLRSEPVADLLDQSFLFYQNTHKNSLFITEKLVQCVNRIETEEDVIEFVLDSFLSG